MNQPYSQNQAPDVSAAEADSARDAAAAKPGWWQRITGGVKRFFSHAIGYIPRGIVFTGVVFAGASILESQTGINLGVNSSDASTLLNHFATHIAFGSVISGALGSAFGNCETCPPNSSGVAQAQSGNPLLNKSEVELGQKITQTVSSEASRLAQNAAMEAAIPGSGLPANLFGRVASGLTGAAGNGR